MVLFEVNDFNKRYSIVLYTQIRIYGPGPKADMPSFSLSLYLSPSPIHYSFSRST